MALLTCIPEVVECYRGPQDPEELSQRISEAKAEVSYEIKLNGEDWDDVLRAGIHPP